MKITELKKRVFEQWQRHCWFNQAVIQPELFKSEVRSQFGDLRRKATWEAALCRYLALNAEIGLLDAYTLITRTFNYTPDRWDYPYRLVVFEEFLTLPDSVELLRTGLEQLFSADFTPQERREANGFFELVQRTTGRELGRDSARSTWQLLSTPAAG
ncbi:MAG TPA: hypothetical protein V6C65_06725 [Allocoleopsis sp.]